MLSLTRPPRPRDFERTVQPHRTAVQKKIDAQEKPAFTPAWTAYKAQFARAQHGKCAYCEMRVIGGAYGDVEHFRPKGEVWALKPDPATWGTETEDLSTVRGREHDPVSDRGYWWLAYDWRNYLLSCQICNQAWKGAFFPVSNSPRIVPPAREAAETALLLNPFERRSPTKHLRFGRLGELTAHHGSRFGRATIDVCGLDRPSLRVARLTTAKRVYRLVQECLDSTTESDERRALEHLRDNGQADADYAGMVRCIFEQETGLAWATLEAL